MGYREFWCRESERQSHGVNETKKSRNTLPDLERDIENGLGMDAECFNFVRGRRQANTTLMIVEIGICQYYIDKQQCS